VSGFWAGAGPGGQMGRCLFGIGIGHATDVLMLSRLRVGVRGCGDDDRVWPTVMGRGRAIVAMLIDSTVRASTPPTGSSRRCRSRWHVRDERRRWGILSRRESSLEEEDWGRRGWTSEWVGTREIRGSKGIGIGIVADMMDQWDRIG